MGSLAAYDAQGDLRSATDAWWTLPGGVRVRAMRVAGYDDQGDLQVGFELAIPGVSNGASTSEVGGVTLSWDNGTFAAPHVESFTADDASSSGTYQARALVETNPHTDEVEIWYRKGDDFAEAQAADWVFLETLAIGPSASGQSSLVSGVQAGTVQFLGIAVAQEPDGQGGTNRVQGYTGFDSTGLLEF